MPLKMTMCWLASAMLSTGCGLLPRHEVLSDPNLPHQLSQDVSIPLLLRQPDGVTYVEGWVLMPKGSWVATEEAIRHPGDPSPAPISETPTQTLGLSPAPAK